MCKPTLKLSFVWYPNTDLEFFPTIKEKYPSASVNPVKNQGSNFSSDLIELNFLVPRLDASEL